MKYVSTGCVSYSSYSGSACGLGVGWIKTDLFNTDSNKHGFGAYIGVVGKDSNQSSFSRKNSAKYGIGLGYHYFLNGISESGLKLWNNTGFRQCIILSVGLSILGQKFLLLFLCL